MSNGFTVEEVLREIKHELAELNAKMDDVVKNGCAHRADDLERIKNLEEWKRRGIIGFIVTTVTIIYEMLVKR